MTGRRAAAGRIAARTGLAGLAACAALALALVGQTEGGRGQSFNNPLRGAGIDACVRPRRATGIPAYTLDGAVLPFTLATGREPGTRPRCRPGELRILRLQALVIGGALSYVRRGGCQSPCVVRQPTVHVLAGELTRPVDLLALAARGGDGAPAGSCPRTVDAAPALVRGALGRMYYKTPAELRRTRRRIGVAGAGARWSNYGDPGRRYRGQGGQAADYGYLLWNLPRRASGGLLPGGGIVEALIGQGQAVELCSVPILTLHSFDAAGAGNGYVVFGYARAANAGPAPIYGWLMLGYRYRGDPFRPTISNG